MKKCIATVVYNDNMIYNLSVYHARNNNLIPLVRYDMNGVKPYKYACFNDMYAAILRLLKNNGFYTGHYTEFGVEWYDIQFINLNNPVKIEKYGFKGV